MPGPVRLVVCINERLGSAQRSCVGSGNLRHIEKIRGMLDAAGLNVPIVERECLGRCEEGPVMRIAPGGPFFTGIDDDTLAVIVAELRRFGADRS